MTQRWSLRDARARFGHVVDQAAQSGPQIITRRGEDVAVVLAIGEYPRLVAGRGALSAFFRRSPLAGADLDLTRDRGGEREGLVE